MILDKLRIVQFRSFNDVEINFSGISLLVGNNNTGKTALMDALAILLGYKKIDKYDFNGYNRVLLIEASFKLEDIDSNNMYGLGSDIEKFKIRFSADLNIRDDLNVDINTMYSLLDEGDNELIPVEDSHVIESNNKVKEILSSISFSYVNDNNLDIELKKVFNELCLIINNFNIDLNETLLSLQEKSNNYLRNLNKRTNKLLFFKTNQIELIENLRNLDLDQKYLFYFSIKEVILSKLQCKGVNYNKSYVSILAVDNLDNRFSPLIVSQLLNNFILYSNDGFYQSIITTNLIPLIKHFDMFGNVKLFSLDDNMNSIVNIIKNQKDRKYNNFISKNIELFFAKIVLLVEGKSEIIILSKFFHHFGINLYDLGIYLVSMDGVYNFEFYCEFLSNLNIKYITILDLDSDNKDGGWFRIKNIIEQLRKLGSSKFSTIENEDVYKSFIENEDKIYDLWELKRVLEEKCEFPNKEEEITIDHIKKALSRRMKSKKERKEPSNEILTKYYDMDKDECLDEMINNLFEIPIVFIKEFIDFLMNKIDVIFIYPLNMDKLMIETYLPKYLDLFAEKFPGEFKSKIKPNTNIRNKCNKIHEKIFVELKNKVSSHEVILSKLEKEDYKNFSLFNNLIKLIDVKLNR